MKKITLILASMLLACACSDEVVDWRYVQQNGKSDRQNNKVEEQQSQTNPPAEEEVFGTAAEAVVKMGAGWNLGNSLDSNSGDADHMWLEAYSDCSPKKYETAWGQPVTTRELMHMFKRRDSVPSGYL